MKGKITAVLFIIVFILVVAVICTFLTSFDTNPVPTPAGTDDGPAIIQEPTAETPGPAPTLTPTMTPVTNTPSPVTNTPAPAATPAPADSTDPGTETTGEPDPIPTPIPTPAATEEVIPANYPSEELGRGSFKSDTGLSLNARADWVARTVSDNRVDIEITVYVESSRLFLYASDHGVNLNLGGKYVTLSTPAVNHDSYDMAVTELAKHTFRVDLPRNSSNSFHLDCVWNYAGTYSGQDVPEVDCGGVISLSRK